MKTSECDADPLPGSLQLRSPELQECKAITVKGSSQAERKIQPVNGAVILKHLTNIERDEAEK